MDLQSIERLVLVGGGVGINPFQSMVQDMKHSEDWLPRKLRVLYATKAVSPIKPEEILFLNELRSSISEMQKSCDAEFKLFLTGVGLQDIKEMEQRDSRVETVMETVARRITEKDLDEALGAESSREQTLVYVCGPKAMTDNFVEYIGSRKGMEKKRVMCEKWW